MRVYNFFDFIIDRRLAKQNISIFVNRVKKYQSIN